MTVAQTPIDDARAAELESTGIDAATGVRGYLPQNTPVAGAQKLSTKYTQTQYHLNRVLESIFGLAVLSKEDGLKVIVKGGEYLLAGSTLTLPDTDPFTCSDDSTCYLYCDGDEVVEESTTAWPGTAHWKLAIVTTADGEISSIVPCQHLNFDPTGSTPWYGVPAAGDVNLAGYDLQNVGFVEANAATELTVASGVITPTQMWHTVDTEGDAATDTLNEITPSSGHHRLLLLTCANPGRVTTVLDGVTNIFLPNGDCELSSGVYLLLFQFSNTSWVELCRSSMGDITLTADLDAAGYDLLNLGTLAFENTSTLTISGGAIAVTGSFHAVETEGGAGTDDLDLATGGAAREVLILRPINTSHTVVVKHGAGAGAFKLQNDLDFAMDSTECTLVCRHNGTEWVEIVRSPQRLRDLVTTSDEDRCIPYSPGPFVVPGALSAGVQDVYVYCPAAFTLENISAYAVTAPSGGSCIVDIQDDGASIFAAEGEMANITDGNHSATSTTKSHKVAAGSWLRTEIKSTGSSPNGAADLTVTVNGYANAQTSPHA